MLHITERYVWVFWAIVVGFVVSGLFGAWKGYKTFGKYGVGSSVFVALMLFLVLNIAFNVFAGMQAASHKQPVESVYEIPVFNGISAVYNPNGDNYVFLCLTSKEFMKPHTYLSNRWK